MKWAFRNETAEKRPKMAIFKLLVLSYMLTTLYFSFFYSNNITKFYVVWKYKKKFESTNIFLVHFKILNFFRLFKYGGRVRKGIVKFCHPLQIANFSMLLVQNCLRYVNIMTFESILGVFLFKTGMFQRIIN